MDSLLWLKALILGLIEGVTEYLPISSTGHLILAGHLLGFNDDRGKLFEVVIQSGAILAVCFYFRSKLTNVTTGLLTKDPSAWRFVGHVLLAFLPLAIVGWWAADWIKRLLFSPYIVASAFIVGGFIMLWVERRTTATSNPLNLEQLSWKTALGIGLIHILALIPGTSRAGASIVGGMLFRLSRPAATEFSFFLALPTLIGATTYLLYKESALLRLEDWPMWLMGFGGAFIAAWFCVGWLLKFVQHHTFTALAWYRIVFGTFIFASYFFNWYDWQ